jgi:hypothetical protein
VTPTEEAISEVLKAKYGQVLVKIHDGRIVRVEKTVYVEPKGER